jgi:hypothetical protein
MSAARGIDPEPIVVSLSWAAERLGIGIDHARTLARKGELPGAFKLGGTTWRVSTVEFRRQIEARAASTDRPPPVPPAPEERLVGVEWASVPRGRFRRSQGHTGRQIAAESPRRPMITGDEPSLVRRPRPQGPSS